MSNKNMLITTAKKLTRSFLPSLVCKVEYSTHVMERNHYRRNMTGGHEIGIVPMYNNIDAGYIMPMMH
ncbi:MAG: hypothetical protein E7185_04630 [Erysipelotrichaceae bacterium]|nr:hypothetical protein [Erysipelotrichaceae bacterium]